MIIKSLGNLQQDNAFLIYLTCLIICPAYVGEYLYFVLNKALILNFLHLYHEYIHTQLSVQWC